MSGPMTVECRVNFQTGGRGRKHLQVGATPPAPEPGRVPRITRLMALAIRFDGLVRSSAVTNYATLARLGQVTRARLTQVMNLTCLAPDLQETILFLPRRHSGRDPITLRDLQPIAQTLDWNEQRRLWGAFQSCLTAHAAR